jgi:protoporphyrinogen oxidase
VDQEYVVLGGGMSGIVAAHLLRGQGHRVVLLETRPELGGVNSGLAWDGYSLDFGCHLFGNESDVSTRVLLELMDGEVSPVDVRFASVLNGQRTEGFELPNLESLGTAVADRILRELLEACAAPATKPENLEEWLIGRYGSTAAQALASCLRKVFPAEPAELAPEAAFATTFRRIRVVSDEVASLLKQLRVVDDRLAQGSALDPMRFYRDRVSLFSHRSFYPKTGGMRGFVDRAEKRLRRSGVEIHTGASIRALTLGDRPQVVTETHGQWAPDHIVWTLGLGRLEPWLGGTQSIASATVSVPMVLYYFAIDKSQETGMSYVNNFDAGSLVFRASVPGSYGGGNCPSGRSYVCCEVPVEFEGPIWQSPAQFERQIWNEVVAMGVATGQPVASFTKRARESYKAPRVDYGARSSAMLERIQNEPRLTVSSEWGFSTSRTIIELVGQLSRAEAA